MSKETRLRIVSIIAVLFIIALTVYAYLMRDRFREFAQYGLLGSFVVEFIANASIALPIPGSLITAAISPFVPPILLILVASLGASLGELSGYLAGLGGKTIIEKSKWFPTVERYMQKYGGVTILVLAAIPNPIFDMAGLAAGMLRMHPLKFFLWCWGGKIINRTAVVFGGFHLIRMIPWLN
mgnify:CR=1 FL=1